ncbi:MAG: cupin domain-containing protein [Chlorobiaceae bacterium]|jgi:quercetin dioxygenase-like cupin family protein|nr:cupin domain-containing protein [Chlorobiaceae bacterium]NTV17028.1 cupin domain-containing protein [Chlorobiaceae bacterium]
MRFVKSIIAFFLLVVMNGAVHAEEYRNVEVEKLITSSTSSNGKPLVYLRTSKPQVTAVVVHVPPGGSTGWHKHPVPVYAYMMEGRLTVELRNGTSFSFKKGDAILEVINTMHNGYNSGSEPASLVVFYTGAVGVPNVIKERSKVAPLMR